nr:uncharacterized protein LOC110559442 [Meriones unguiculatus]
MSLGSLWTYFESDFSPEFINDVASISPYLNWNPQYFLGSPGNSVNSEPVSSRPRKVCFLRPVYRFASQEEKTVTNAQLPPGNMENSRTERQRCSEKLDVPHPGTCPWAETEEKTWSELQEALVTMKAAEKMCWRIQRIELENSNLIATLEEQAREMEELGEKLIGAGIHAEEASQEDPGKPREDAAPSWSPPELMKCASELSKMRMQDDLCKMEVKKYKELYLKELRDNNALLSLLSNRTGKHLEQSCANLELWRSTSAVVALVEPHPECPQVPPLTSSVVEPQGSVSQPHGGPEASCDSMKKPQSSSENKKTVRKEEGKSARSLLCALHREARRTKELQRELTEIKKIFNMYPKEGHGCEGRGHSFREVPKVNQTEMSVPVVTLNPEGEAAAEEHRVWVQETPRASSLAAMELEMRRIQSAIAEANIRERSVKKELAVMKQLYRGELERIDSMWLDVVKSGREPASRAHASPLRPAPRTCLRPRVGCGGALHPGRLEDMLSEPRR